MNEQEGNTETAYLETGALVCAMENNEEGAKEKLRKLSHNERKRLQVYFLRLDDWIDEVNDETAAPSENAA